MAWSCRASRSICADLATARHLLEPLCVSLAARRTDREKVAAELEALIDESEELIDDGAAFTASLLKFHEALVTACQNETLQILVGTVERVWESQERAWAKEATERGDYPDEEGTASTRWSPTVESPAGSAKGDATAPRAPRATTSPPR